jgi:hypothetical protein
MPQLDVKGCSHPVFRTDRLRVVSVVRLSTLAYMHMHDIMRFRRSCLQGNYTALIVLQTAGMTEPCSLTQVPACCNLGLNMRCTGHWPGHLSTRRCYLETIVEAIAHVAIKQRGNGATHPSSDLFLGSRTSRPAHRLGQCNLSQRSRKFTD